MIKAVAGNVDMVKKLAEDWSYGQEGRWITKIWSRWSLGNECMVKGFAGE